MANDRRSARAPLALVTIDLRNPDELGKTETARNLDAIAFARVISILVELLKPNSVFFDFGVVSLRDVNLVELAFRLDPGAKS